MKLGFGQILTILGIALLVSGPTTLPLPGDALGDGIRDFQRGTEGTDDAPPSGEPQRLGASFRASRPVLARRAVIGLRGR
jgi:Sec-independent protein translocase protein TatA